MTVEGEKRIYKQSLSKQIIATATANFLAKGVKSVKMDDIAGELSMSKRTLYEIFSNKEELLLECVKQMHYEYKEHMESLVRAAGTTVIDIVIETYRYQMAKLDSISQEYYDDLRKYPAVVAWLNEEHKRDESKATEFYHKGVEEGFFRNDVDFNLISKVNVGTIDYIMENQLFKQYSMKQIFHNIILLYVRGFCTLKGVKALEYVNL